MCIGASRCLGGKDPSVPPIMPKIEFILWSAVIKWVIPGKAALCASNKGSKKLKGDHIPENVSRMSLLVRAAWCCRRSFLFVHLFREMPPRGEQAGCSGCRLLPAPAASPVDVNVRAFFLLPQVPSSVQSGRRLLCRRRLWRKGKKKKKRKKKEWAYQSLPWFLNRSVFPPLLPPRGHFHKSVWQNKKRCRCFCMANESLIG